MTKKDLVNCLPAYQSQLLYGDQTAADLTVSKCAFSGDYQMFVTHE